MADLHNVSRPPRPARWLMTALLGCLAVVIALGASMLVIYQRMQPRAENLWIAAIHWPEDIPKLLAGGADVNEQNREGNTPLHLAVRFNKPESVRLLLDAGADPNIADFQGETPLLSATFNAHRQVSTRIALMLIGASADPNVHSIHADHTPLHRASKHRNLVIARALLDAGADPDALKKYDETPLHVAGSADMVELLVAGGADIEARMHNGNTPLQLAVARGHYDVVESLLAAGASTESENQYGMKPIDQRQGDERMAALFSSATATTPE
ncbi:Ankyrin repeat protein [Maioricimonas rarisocia]|uniref:Ankyrin repeat protein n=1 Tax=Maioricimonas rarisocia TaxID=2528026 RepID=A0A517Z3V2_9PLAN|nr:ankyrin repeat domain-containing protein [Maioricimonas rarisocia]QDU37115.1 Ankyrin repeat protein [Maioricimonas rarisocia]